MSLHIGIDLGGTKIEVIALDEGGHCLLRERVATPQGDYAATVQAIAGLVALAKSSVGADKTTASETTDETTAQQEGAGQNPARFAADALQGGRAKDALCAVADGMECRPGTADPLHRSEAAHCETRTPPPSWSLGIGIPGTESADSGLIKNANSICLNGKPLRHDLQGLLGHEVHIANDANCFALSEAIDGAASGAAVVFGVILGTGVGGGVVVNGQVLPGRNGITGEWGHNPLPEFASESGDHQRICYCGRKHCIELYLSGPGLLRDHVHGLRQRDESVNLTSAAEIVAAASAGDARCEVSLQRYERRLARALAGVINILDPDLIVLGGGLSNIERLYENVPRLWAAHVFSDTVKTRLVKPMHGDSSGVRGAAWLAR